MKIFMSGRAALSLGTARGSRYGPTVGMAPSLSRVMPADSSACATASKSVTHARISRARSARVCPTGVIRTEWVLRSATFTPSRASISFRPVDRVDWVTLQSSAAREKFSVSARATRNRICRRVVMGVTLIDFPDHHRLLIQFPEYIQCAYRRLTDHKEIEDERSHRHDRRHRNGLSPHQRTRPGVRRADHRWSEDSGRLSRQMADPVFAPGRLHTRLHH